MSGIKEHIKSLNAQSWMMIGLIVILLICIMTRWDWIKQEAGDAFRTRIERIKGNPDAMAPQDGADSGEKTMNTETSTL